VDIGPRKLGVARLVASKTNRNEPITYWTAVGAETFSSDADRRLIRLSSALEGIIPDGMLVRVSSIDRDEAHAFAVQDDFIRNLNLGLAEAVRGRIFGRPA
jgi:EpsI family protein